MMPGYRIVEKLLAPMRQIHQIMKERIQTQKTKTEKQRKKCYRGKIISSLCVKRPLQILINVKD